MPNRVGLGGSADLMLAPCTERRSRSYSYGQGARQNRGRQTHLDILRHFRRIKPQLAQTFPLRNASDVGESAATFAVAQNSSESQAPGSRSAENEEEHGRSLAKAVSWRSAASIDTFVLSLLITGSIKTAGSISAVEIGTKILLFYFHERIWTLIPWGRRR
jgi:uncharacterized membrane protein